MTAHCQAKDDPNSQWPPFCPNKGAAYLYAILFALTFIAHVTQGIIYRKGYSWVVAMGALWEFGCYIFRILSINNPTNSSFYTVYFLLILLAPLWINAYVYMVLGRMVYNFTASARIMHVKAWRFGLIFILLDILYVLSNSHFTLAFHSTSSLTFGQRIHCSSRWRSIGLRGPSPRIPGPSWPSHLHGRCRPPATLHLLLHLPRLPLPMRNEA